MKIRFYNIIIGLLLFWHILAWPCDGVLARLRKKRWVLKLNRINNLQKKRAKSQKSLGFRLTYPENIRILYIESLREKIFQRIMLWTTITRSFPPKDVGSTDSIVTRIFSVLFILLVLSCLKLLSVLVQSLSFQNMNVPSFLGTKKVLDKSEIVYYISSVSLRENLIKG